jgi:hypothetical protein
MRFSTAIKLALPAALAVLACAPVASAAAPCTVRSYPGQPPKHTTNLNLKPKYNSFPPTSGIHYASTAKFNMYPYELPQIAVVHNLEHGGVAIQYGAKVPKATVAKIRSWYLRDTNALLVAPLAALGNKIALTAWNAPPYPDPRANPNPDPGRGWVGMCSRFDAAAFTAFVRQHRYKAGERLAKKYLVRQQ